MQRRNAAVRRTPKGLAFADHVNRFVTGQRAPSGPKGTEVLAGFDPPLDGAVILFHQIVKVTSDPVPAVFAQNPFGLELRDGGRVSPMPVGVDHPRRAVVLSAQGLGQETLGGCRVRPATPPRPGTRVRSANTTRRPGGSAPVRIGAT
jgi:hypothetical protein